MPIFLPRKPETQPRVVCFCHLVWAMISASVAPPLRFSIAMTSSLLLRTRAVLSSPDSLAFCASFAFAAFLPLGVALAGVVLLVALPLAGAPFADFALPVAFFPAFGFAAASVAASCSGFAASPSPWMRAQIRLAQRSLAAFVSGRLLSATTPGRLFHVATRRSAGQALASSASFCSVLKLSKGVCVVGTDGFRQA